VSGAPNLRREAAAVAAVFGWSAHFAVCVAASSLHVLADRLNELDPLR